MKSPLTAESNTELLQVLTPVDIAERWRIIMGVDVGATFAALPAIEYWRCKTTGLAWYMSSPSEAAGGPELYAQLEEFGWYSFRFRYPEINSQDAAYFV